MLLLLGNYRFKAVTCLFQVTHSCSLSTLKQHIFSTQSPAQHWPNSWPNKRATCTGIQSSGSAPSALFFFPCSWKKICPQPWVPWHWKWIFLTCVDLKLFDRSKGSSFWPAPQPRDPWPALEGWAITLGGRAAGLAAVTTGESQLSRGDLRSAQLYAEDANVDQASLFTQKWPLHWSGIRLICQNIP